MFSCPALLFLVYVDIYRLILYNEITRTCEMTWNPRAQNFKSQHEVIFHQTYRKVKKFHSRILGNKHFYCTNQKIFMVIQFGGCDKRCRIFLVRWGHYFIMFLERQMLWWMALLRKEYFAFLLILICSLLLSFGIICIVLGSA